MPVDPVFGGITPPYGAGGGIDPVTGGSVGGSGGGYGGSGGGGYGAPSWGAGVFGFSGLDQGQLFGPNDPMVGLAQTLHSALLPRYLRTAFALPHLAAPPLPFHPLFNPRGSFHG